MSLQAHRIDLNPLAQFNNGAVARIGGIEKPIPLTATRIEVKIRGGLATVATERTFRNQEDCSIEATMTFPVPVDAVLHALSARIDGRHLVAAAQARSSARATYEDALDRGKTAVLHEELLRGIHMLSVGHVRSGGEVAVTSVWTAPLTFAGATPTLRIPTTVGEIYGRSPLADCDDLVAGGPVHTATLSIACRDGVATLHGGGLADGIHTVPLDRPIDIAVQGSSPRTLAGIAADGRTVTLDLEPVPQSERTLDADLLVDRSSSMAETADGDAETRNLSKFNVMTAALAAAADRLHPGDRIRLFEFNNDVRMIGTGTGPDACKRLVRKIRGPSGGTETGKALLEIAADPCSGNVVIVTDGKTYALDVQQFTRSGLRVTAVLVGEDALDANVSNLAGVTGGQVFVSAGCDADTAILAALNAARMPHTMTLPISGAPTRIETCRRGARVTAAWGGKTDVTADAEARAIAAFAASLAIPAMEEHDAAQLAEAEGLVCHLTSLVLVDEAAETQQGIPATRKVALSTPRTDVVAFAAMADVARSLPGPEVSRVRMATSAQAPVTGFDVVGKIRSLVKHRSGPAPTRPPAADFRQTAGRIDWDSHPDLLRQGDLSGLDADVADLIRAAAALPAIRAFASQHALDPIVAVIYLMARNAAATSRSAARLARALLGSASPEAMDEAARSLGL
jgi:vault protein inter-alpha-trypsin-like protein/VWA domain-containing protein